MLSFYVTITKVSIHKVGGRMMCPFMYLTGIEYLLWAKHRNKQWMTTGSFRVPVLKTLSVFPWKTGIYCEWKNFGLLETPLKESSISQMHVNPAEILLKFWFFSVTLRWGLRCCISTKLLGSAKITGPKDHTLSSKLSLSQ